MSLFHELGLWEDKMCHVHGDGPERRNDWEKKNVNLTRARKKGD